MNKFLQTAIQNPKSTVSGLLSFVAITSTVLIPFSQGKKYLAALAISSALAKAYNAALSLDPGKQLADVPGEGITTVPAHETPDDPSATPVKN